MSIRSLKPVCDDIRARGQTSRPGVGIYFTTARTLHLTSRDRKQKHTKFVYISKDLSSLSSNCLGFVQIKTVTSNGIEIGSRRESRIESCTEIEFENGTMIDIERGTGSVLSHECDGDGSQEQ
ncbi:hypothetical protein EVAR_19233_1 [Eumeta japonica]|uniref:Uncharacterized protein n=1 Tax=Eumeta variegata TaxID=151549 RepID=A0A4C1VGH2_EUMVA|nr:hypothetical protein EVAR_19233_1 [Eumeta japonica]